MYLRFFILHKEYKSFISKIEKLTKYRKAGTPNCNV